MGKGQRHAIAWNEGRQKNEVNFLQIKIPIIFEVSSNFHMEQKSTPSISRGHKLRRAKNDKTYFRVQPSNSAQSGFI